MLITHRDTCKRSAGYDHRPGGINLIELQHGTEFTPNNFQLYLIETEDAFETPRHRHNFEQVRIMLNGEFEWGPERVQRPGTVGYFCEGTFYTQKGRGDSTMLLLQVAGAGGQGYMSPRQLRQGIDELKASGSFRDGIFYAKEADGTERGRDSYEAVWEYINKRELQYPRPRYDGPVMMNIAAFAWVNDPAQPGVATRPLGRFNERGLTIGMLRVEPDATAVITADRPTLLYAVAGKGTAGTDEAWQEGCAIQLAAGEQLSLAATEQAELFTFGLPVFDSSK